jgi:V/A-type H+/Na+-transporting ATPase subunit B
MAIVHGRLAQVVKIMGDDVILQVFSGTEGIPTNAEVMFLGRPPQLKVSDQLAGRFFNAFGDPIDGGPAVDGEIRDIGSPSVNPVRRKQPSDLIATGIAGIDLNNTLVTGQKDPIFCGPRSALQSGNGQCGTASKADKINFGGHGFIER